MGVSMQIHLMYCSPLSFPSLELSTPVSYTLMIYIDPEVQPPLPKHDKTKHPKSHKTRQKDIIATVSK